MAAKEVSQMGAPAMAWFCPKGHLVQRTAHHEIADDPKRCHECGARRFGTVFEWGDPDYHENVDEPVPQKPTRYEVKRTRIPEAVNAEGNPIEAYVDRRVPVYDVSKLTFRKPLPSSW